jgi:hypothetical protein
MILLVKPPSSTINTMRRDVKKPIKPTASAPKLLVSNGNEIKLEAANITLPEKLAKKSVLILFTFHIP